MKRIFFLLLIINCQLSIVHGEDIQDVFIAMPDSLLSLLTTRNRHDMVDFYHNHMEAKVRNRLGDYVRLDTLCQDYLRLTLSKVSTAEMRLLETTDSVRLIVLVRTTAAPVRDSHVAFFDAGWQQLPWLKLPVPPTADFFSAVPDSVARDMDFVQRSVDDLRLVEVTLSPEEPVFTLSLSVAELAEEEKKVARRYVRPVRFRWTGRDFQQVVEK